MTKFTIKIIINRPLDIVLKAYLNPGNMPYWTKYLEKFEIIKGKENEVGSIGRLHYLQNGRSYIMEDQLIDCEPGKRYVSRVSGYAITANVETTLNSSGNKTEIEVTWSGTGKIFFLKLFMPLLRGKMAKQAQAELDTFKDLVEKRGIDFSKT